MSIWDRSWFAPAVLVVVLVGGALAAFVFGSQTADILSTVGASVPANPVAGGDTTGGTSSGGDTTGDSSGDSSSSGAGGAEKGGVGAGTGVIQASVQDDLLIIKTGELTVQVDDIASAVTAATQKVDALDGYVSGSERSGTGQDARATVAFRVPAVNWDAAMNAIRGLPGQIVDEQSKTEDVTGQVVDLGARIRNLQATEQALQGIMGKTSAIKDVLSVQAELTTTRGQIEELTAELAHLQDQAAYSSLSVTFVLTPEPVLAVQQGQFDPRAEVDAASASLVGAVQDVEKAGIWIGIVWLPILVAVAIVAAAAVAAFRRVRRTA